MAGLRVAMVFIVNWFVCGTHGFSQPSPIGDVAMQARQIEPE